MNDHEIDNLIERTCGVVSRGGTFSQDHIGELLDAIKALRSQRDAALSALDTTRAPTVAEGDLAKVIDALSDLEARRDAIDRRGRNATGARRQYAHGLRVAIDAMRAALSDTEGRG